MTWRSVFLGVAGLAFLCAVAASAIFFGAFQTSVVAHDVDEPLSDSEMASLAERGAYVAKAADCYACHTAPGGAPWAGGLAFETPFGTIHATNISPDKEQGIGDWTRAEFHRAVRDGVGEGGTHLYPAMPYVSYRQMTPQDVDAVYAYLMTRAPMPVANKDNALAFPFNIRRLLTFWNLLNLPDETFQTVEEKSDQWNRGHYIVDALAHCGECHTPRNLLQGMERSAYLEGAVLEGVEAPDITRAGLETMGFDAPSLARFMKTGLSAQGAMTGQMFEVVHYSTQYMRDDDLAAMVAYLFDTDETSEGETPAPAPVEVPAQTATSGRDTFLNLCSGCHGVEGQGIPHVVVPLATNISLRLASPRNFLHAVLHGIPAQDFPGLERMEPMPSFADRLDDRAAAELATWMRARWGGRAKAVTVEDVASIREQ
ncbi:MAG: cytochrome c [Pseudomonadota bacterium]|nr:cytochrome c [Pseudomonadota bacterium]